MSASAVSLGNPCSLSASAPIRMKFTLCSLSARNNSSGSKAAISDTTCGREEAAHLSDLAQTLLGRERENARDIIQKLRIDGDPAQFGIETEAGCLEQPRQRRPRWARFPQLYAGDHRLRGARLFRQMPLRQARARARGLKE